VFRFGIGRLVQVMSLNQQPDRIMKTTIITGVAAIALVAPSFAGAPVVYTAPTPAPAPSNLGLSGDIGLAYQNQYAFRGVSGVAAAAVGSFGNFDTDNIVTADINADYAFTENFSIVAGAVVRSLGDTSIDHNTYRVGAVWNQADCFSIEFGYQYQDFRTIAGSGNNDELYLNLGAVCPWTGADFNLFWAHALSGLGGFNGIGSSDLLKGDYIELNGHKSFELTEWAAADITLGISYGVDYWSKGSDFNNWYATLAFPMKATDYLTVTPYVTYMDGLGATENVFGSIYSEGDEFLWGVKASVDF